MTASSQPTDGEASTPSQNLFALPAALLQLLFSEASLLSDERVSAQIDHAIAITSSSAQPSITSSGLSPMLVRLLSSPRQKRRSWAMSQLPACARRPLSLEEWRSTGVGEEVKALYTGTGDASTSDRLSGMEALLQSKALSLETIQHGVIGGETSLDQGTHAGAETGFMSTLSHLLGGQVDRESSPLCVDRPAR